MKFRLYIDKKFTASGTRVFVKMLSDTIGQSNIFICRMESRLAVKDSTTIPVYLFGNKTSFSGPSKIGRVQDRSIFETVATPNSAIGAGSTYRAISPNIMVLKDVTGKLDQDYINAFVSFPTYASDYPLWADIDVPESYSDSSTYEAILNPNSNKIRIIDVLDSRTAVLNIKLPSNTGLPIKCRIEGSQDTIEGECFIQSSYSSAGTYNIINPDPFVLVLQDGFIEQAANTVQALSFIRSIKIGVKSYIDMLKSIGISDSVEVVTYEV